MKVYWYVAGCFIALIAMLFVFVFVILKSWNQFIEEQEEAEKNDRNIL